MRHFLSLAAFALLTCALPAQQPTAPPTPASSGFDDWWSGPTLSGNLLGYSPKLKEAGVDFFGYYSSTVSTNFKGGIRHDNAYADDFFFGFNLDLQKLINWRGATLTINAVNRDGVSIRHDVGSIYDPQQMYGAQSVFLYDVVIEQNFLENRFSWKLGRFGASDDFNTSILYSFYLNNGINGNIRNILFDTQFNAYPYASWGTRIKFKPTKDTYAEAGIFQTSSTLFNPQLNGLSWGFDSFNGWIALFEAGWTPELWKRPVSDPDPKDGKTARAPELKGMPGQYFIGATLSNSDYQRFSDSSIERKQYGFYAHASQMVYQEKPGAEQGLTLFTAMGYCPKEAISIVPFQLNVGAIYEGLLPVRPNDRTILGLIYGRISRSYAGTLIETGQGNPTHELVVEAAYRIQLAKFAYAQPDFQWIQRPGGTGQIPDAYILGAQFGVTF